MSDVNVETPSTIVRIPVVKSKGFVEIDTAKIPERVYLRALELGLKQIVNGGTTKITKSTYPKEDELKAAAQAKAEERLEEIMTDKIKLPGQKAAKSGVPREVQTEAMRLARNLVKDECKKAGIKISHVKSSEITAAAKALLESDLGKDILAQAEANLKEREQVPTGKAINIAALVHEDPALKAKAEKRKADKGLSAKQAGMVNKRSKGADATAH